MIIAVLHILQYLLPDNFMSYLALKIYSDERNGFTRDRWLMEPGGSMLHSQGLSNIPILSRINTIPRIDTYLFKVHSNIVLPPTPP